MQRAQNLSNLIPPSENLINFQNMNTSFSANKAIFIPNYTIPKSKLQKVKTNKKIQKDQNLINLIPPSELSFHFIPQHVIQKCWIKQNPCTCSYQRSLSINPNNLSLQILFFIPTTLCIIQFLNLHR